MVGVNAVIGGSIRQDLATGAPLSNAEGNAQVIVGAFSLATTFTGAGAAGAAGKAGSVLKGTQAVKSAGVVTDSLKLGRRLAGETLSYNYIDKLEKYLAKRGVSLEFGGPESGFSTSATGKATLKLRRGATHYDAWHELSHYLDYRRLGKQGYRALPRPNASGPNLIPEQLVYDRLKQPNRWRRLTPEQQAHATKYVCDLGGRQ